uniref:Phospholipase n=1 Tax=Ciona intestinalis TaxID=7719 RepID=F6WA81_CIOIN
IPYMSIYGSPSRLIVGVGSPYLAKTPLSVNITCVKHDVTYRHPLNPNLYTIELAHGQFTWTIYRRYKHFIELHEKLWTYRASLKIPLPSKKHRRRRLTTHGMPKKESKMPQFPKTPEILVSSEDLDKRKGKVLVENMCDSIQIPVFDSTCYSHAILATLVNIKLLKFVCCGLPNQQSYICSPVEKNYIINNIDQLCLYLQAMLKSRMYRKHPATVSNYWVVQAFPNYCIVTHREGVINKRSGGHKEWGIMAWLCCQSGIYAHCININAYSFCLTFRIKWFVVKDTFIAYLDPSQDKIKGVLLFDAVLNVLHQAPSSRLVISNISRSLNVDCWTDRQALDWKRAIEHSFNNLSYGLTAPDIRHQSFAPPREDSYAYWFVDGRSYFDAVADAIEEAREEIYITDWWLSPEIYMKRPIVHGDHWRLDKLLKRKAVEGVKIYVQLYKEVEMAVGLDSAYTKRTLNEMHPTNIRVMRHPDLTPGETLLWAHHEKIVVIDQSIAFVGGIDLCYGRWDDQDHKLTDTGGVCSTDFLPRTLKTMVLFFEFEIIEQGKFSLCYHYHIYQLPRAPSPVEPEEPAATGFKKRLRSLRPRKKVRDQSFIISTQGCKPFGSGRFLFGLRVSVATMSRMIDRLRFNERSRAPFTADTHSPINDKNESYSFYTYFIIHYKCVTNDCFMVHKIRVNLNAAPLQASSVLTQYKDMVNQVEYAAQSKLWIGKDYNNFILKDLTQLDDPFGDVMDRLKTPRMPWHDIACVTYGKAARDAARHFIQRWNYTKIQKAKKGEHISFLLPKSYSDDAFNLPKELMRPEAVQAKILRSSCEWSAGLSEVDRSIQNAYIAAIDNSQHFIYIENQFFISCLRNAQVGNQICTTLVRRIIRAHKNKKAFRVYVVMPLLPGFEGDISKSGKSQAIRTVLHWQYKSINRGSASMFEELDKEIGPGNAWRYISFCGLRTHSKLMGKPITEIIYVHSKMMIVDDRLVIIGSANINDRSMSGTRDSEVAMLVEDSQLVDSTMDGKPCKVGVYASSLRRRCFAEHLGLLPDDYDGRYILEDVASEAFFKDVWMKTAAVNTTSYEKVFCCVPSDYVRKLTDIESFQKTPLVESDPEAAETTLQKIKGYLVLLPLLFLIDEDLTPDVMTKEAMAPTDLWT